MGEALVPIEQSSEMRATFIAHLLKDIKALEIMLEGKMLEEGIFRIGAEQEFCLVTDNWRPSKASMEILQNLHDPHFTTELARFNLEINLDPLELKDKCFSEMEQHLNTFLNKADEVAKKFNNQVVLTGILPTISKRELELEFMTPSPRYQALNELTKALRGKDFELSISGVDELAIIHDSVLFEACNTSFQMHLQISPDDFISSYNWALAISAPVLGIASNSPLLLGRELWSETRIALFQQSIDTRSSSYALKDQSARVTFGNSWAHSSIAELYKNNLSLHKVLLTKSIDKDSLEELAQGNMPKLQALSLHNSTIYQWNRACYGVANNKAHLRIENRYLPAGPTTMDEMANFAFWVGIMLGRPAAFDHLPAKMDFRDAKANFFKAARTGKESVLQWMDEQISVRDLVLNKLLPLAYAGLKKAEIHPDDIAYYLGIIEQRAVKETGSQWTVRNYRKLKDKWKKDEALLMLTKAMVKNQHSGIPLHDWPPVDPGLETHEFSTLVCHIMSTELYTVNENDLAELATSVMLWKNIHHLPVENKAGQLCGLLTWTHIKRFREKRRDKEQMVVAEIMTKDLLTARPETAIPTAIGLMKRNEIGCLPVVQDRHLVGIITIKDVIPYDHG